MSDATSDISPRDAMNILKGMLFALDPQEPNDMAFKMVSIVLLSLWSIFVAKKLFFIMPHDDSPFLLFQCIVHNMPVIDALAYTNASGTRQAMHQRIGWWKNSLSAADLLVMQVAHGVVPLDDALEEVLPPNPSRTTELTPPNPSRMTELTTVSVGAVVAAVAAEDSTTTTK